jgi:hypothetical protein
MEHREEVLLIMKSRGSRQQKQTSRSMSQTCELIEQRPPLWMPGTCRHMMCLVDNDQGRACISVPMRIAVWTDCQTPVILAQPELPTQLRTPLGHKSTWHKNQSPSIWVVQQDLADHNPGLDCLA